MSASPATRALLQLVQLHEPVTREQLFAHAEGTEAEFDEQGFGERARMRKVLDAGYVQALERKHNTELTRYTLTALGRNAAREHAGAGSVATPRHVYMEGTYRGHDVHATPVRKGATDFLACPSLINGKPVHWRKAAA